MGHMLSEAPRSAGRREALFVGLLAIAPAQRAPGLGHYGPVMRWGSVPRRAAQRARLVAGGVCEGAVRSLMSPGGLSKEQLEEHDSRMRERNPAGGELSQPQLKRLSRLAEGGAALHGAGSAASDVGSNVSDSGATACSPSTPPRVASRQPGDVRERRDWSFLWRYDSVGGRDPGRHAQEEGRQQSAD